MPKVGDKPLKARVEQLEQALYDLTNSVSNLHKILLKLEKTSGGSVASALKSALGGKSVAEFLTLPAPPIDDDDIPF